jgi:hypothetical protein
MPSRLLSGTHRVPDQPRKHLGRGFDRQLERCLVRLREASGDRGISRDRHDGNEWAATSVHVSGGLASVAGSGCERARRSGRVDSLLA